MANITNAAIRAIEQGQGTETVTVRAHRTPEGRLSIEADIRLWTHIIGLVARETRVGHCEECDCIGEAMVTQVREVGFDIVGHPTDNGMMWLEVVRRGPEVGGE